MRKVSRFLILSLVLLGIAASAFAGQYSEAFPQYLASHKSGTMVPAIITMADRLDLGALQNNLSATHADRRLWHETVVRALQAKATESQADLLAALSVMTQNGEVESYSSLWIGNMVIVTATPEALDQLVSRNDVMLVSPDYLIESIEPVHTGGNSPTIAGHEIGATRLHVPEVWAMGITGEGRLVSHLDTGVQGSHPALAARWRGVADTRYEGHPQWAWYDPRPPHTTFPTAFGAHGTHTMGTICGRSTSTPDTVGVAIDAQWISAGVIDRVDIPTTMADAITALQWIADPDADPSTVWDVPDVCSNSWGVRTDFGYPPCDETLWEVIDGAEAASVVVVFAAGNEGYSGARTIRRPADRATTELNCFSVGAVNGDNPSLPIADFSSRGPANCTPSGNDTFKPEVVAPGVNVRSSVPGGGYESGWDGTSMATPHIAGIIALMRQANPNLTVDQIKQILLDTATDLGTSGEDNAYGKGIANALAAVQMALSYLDGWGTLGGVITDQASGTPIQGARVSVIGRPWGASSRGNGEYFMFAPADTLWQIKVEYPPTHLSVFDTVTIAENDTIIRNYALEGKVAVLLKASFANPANVDYRTFFIKGSWDAEGMYDSTWSGPQIEIKDDGVSPDQTIHDGIFTGKVLLRIDGVHTYRWALYSESNGGDAARLQPGADIQIPNATPPVIPTLAVNPSGSDNNWIISAIGDNSLNLDLVRNFGNVATKWGAACTLYTPNTYTFRFKVMHSDSASYGSGGIGGPDLHFTPPITGSYVFVFNDATDMYYVLMSGTQGPPTTLAATSGLDHHVTLTWRAPTAPEPPLIVPPDNGTPRIMDTEVLAGYNVYRDTLPYPFDRNLLVNNSLITVVNYDDHGGLQGHLTNGKTYYYQTSAVYDIGGGQLVEAGPSNQALATPQNHPPATPTFLIAGSAGRVINLKWNFLNDIGDLDHFSVERMLMPSGAWTEVGTTVDTVFSQTIPDGEDGSYGYRVTAIDDGTPALSSTPSQPAYAMVGHLAPGTLRATSGEEFQVPVHWALPGSWTVNGILDPETPIIYSDEDGSADTPGIMNRGEPDAAGYLWIDSDEPGGPTYQWRDITGIGQQIPMNGDNQLLGSYNIGFSFPFYGNDFNTFRICSNGWLSFTDSTHNYSSNRALPSTQYAPFNLVAPFWDDLTFIGGGQLWYYSDGVECIISYIEVPHVGSGGPYSFQAILRSSGAIIYQYGSMGTVLNSATIGIQNGTGTIGLQAVYNANYVHDNMAIQLNRPADGFSPAHFKLYRSTTSPVPLDDSHLIAGSIPGIQAGYVDRLNIQNGIPYFYKVTAVWPDSIESVASNETTGTAANHPPIAPTNLAGLLNGRTINLHWSFANLVGDWDHYNIYKRALPLGVWLLTSTTNDTLGAVTIPAGQDGVYEIAVTAVDNGTPQLESRYSRAVTFNVGNLAPVQLAARSDHDLAVPLNWMHPGTWLMDDHGDQPLPGIASMNGSDPSALPTLFGRGGPDGAGYIWVDSDEPDGPDYQWRDITAIGQQIPMIGDNQILGAFNIGFSFPFYGNNFNTFRVNSNGWLSFTDSIHTYNTNRAIPSTVSAPFNLVAPFWDDLTFVGGGQLWYYSDGAECIISYIAVPRVSSGGPCTFQVILRSSGTIVYQYGAMGTVLNSATVGIQNSDGTIGLQVVCNGDYMHDNMAIQLQNLSEGISPVHYKLYRSTSSPVPVDPGHLITSAIAGDRLSYTDTGSVVNGTRYYYVLTAVWPDSAESPASNETSAIPVMGARMTLNPTSLDLSIESGRTILDTLNIANPGGLSLNWNLFTQSDLILSVPKTADRSGVILESSSRCRRGFDR